MSPSRKIDDIISWFETKPLKTAVTVQLQSFCSFSDPIIGKTRKGHSCHVRSAHAHSLLQTISVSLYILHFLLILLADNKRLDQTAALAQSDQGLRCPHMA